MRVLVTGGAGYLGSILVPMMLNHGFSVTVVDNFMYGQQPLSGVCVNPRFNAVRGDARDTRILGDLVPKHDVLIPLAALVGAPLCALDPVGARTVNVDAVWDLVCRTSNDQTVIIPISNSGYGVGETGKECTEDSPLRPVSLYGKTKVEAEEKAMSRGNAISFRLATLFGMSPRMRLDLLVNDFVWRAVNDRAVVLFEADFKRNYLHVRDAARVFIHAAERPEMRGNIYNAGLSDANLSKRELCAKIAEHFALKEFVALESPVGEDPDKRDYVVSNAKIEAAGWQPLLTLDDGITELVKGYSMMKKVAYGNI